MGEGAPCKRSGVCAPHCGRAAGVTGGRYGGSVLSLDMSSSLQTVPCGAPVRDALTHAGL
jgi:hypothetical protein